MRAASVAGVAIGGVAGAKLRWVVGELLDADTAGLLALLAVNTAGSLMLGFVVFAGRLKGWSTLSDALGTGFCGSLTTFSAFAVLAAESGQDSGLLVATAIAVVCVLSALTALLAGRSLAARVLPERPA